MNGSSKKTSAGAASKPGAVNRLDMVRSMHLQGGSFGLAAEGRRIVNISLIDEDPRNERRTFRNLEGLAASVKAFGVLEPPTVFELPGGRFQIITGHRRFRAAKMAGLERIEVLVRSPEDDKTRRRKSIVSNIQREDVNPVELANALQSLLDDNEVESQAALAEAIGKDKTWVSKMLRILTLPPAAQEKVATSQLLISYDAVAEIARLDDRERQEQLIDFLLSGASARDVRREIRASKKTVAQSSGATPDAGRRYTFRTGRHATVIIQSHKEGGLTAEQKIAALKEAIRAVRENG